MTKEGSLVDKILVDKFTGWMRSIKLTIRSPRGPLVWGWLYSLIELLQ